MIGPCLGGAFEYACTRWGFWGTVLQSHSAELCSHREQLSCWRVINSLTVWREALSHPHPHGKRSETSHSCLNLSVLFLHLWICECEKDKGGMWTLKKRESQSHKGSKTNVTPQGDQEMGKVLFVFPLTVPSTPLLSLKWTKFSFSRCR